MVTRDQVKGQGRSSPVKYPTNREIALSLFGRPDCRHPEPSAEAGREAC